MQPKPYVGITGFGHRVEVDSVLNALPTTFNHLLMIGIGVRDKPHPNRGPNRYPADPILADICVEHPKVMTLFHVSMESDDGLLDYMEYLRELAGPNLGGFQINLPWPSVRVLEAYKRATPSNNTIVLACDAVAFRKVGRSPQKLALRAKDYDGLIDYIVPVDMSGGDAKTFDEQLVLGCFDEIATLMPDLGLVAVGGLHAGNARAKLSSIFAEYESSCDAEGGLRTKDDLLNVAESVRYAITADALMTEFEAQRQVKRQTQEKN